MERAEASIIVGATVEQVYQVWRHFENFPHFMENIKEVTRKNSDGKLSHWTVAGPFGKSISFDAEMTIDEPNTRIGWNSRGQGTLHTSGQVVFTELGTQQTQVHVIMNWTPPAGKAGQVIANMTNKPQAQLEGDLRRFKHMIEGGKLAQAAV